MAKRYNSETLRKLRSIDRKLYIYSALVYTIVRRPLGAMFVHKVRELDVLRLLSVRVEVVTDLVHLHGDPMFPRLVAVVCVAHESGRVRRDDFG